MVAPSAGPDSVCLSRIAKCFFCTNTYSVRYLQQVANRDYLNKSISDSGAKCLARLHDSWFSITSGDSFWYDQYSNVKRVELRQSPSIFASSETHQIAGKWLYSEMCYCIDKANSIVRLIALTLPMTALLALAPGIPWPSSCTNASLQLV